MIKRQPGGIALGMGWTLLPAISSLRGHDVTGVKHLHWDSYPDPTLSEWGGNSKDSQLGLKNSCKFTHGCVLLKVSSSYEADVQGSCVCWLLQPVSNPYVSVCGVGVE